MEPKVSKAQLEVWEWKEAAYQQIKDMPYNQRIQFIINQARDTVAESEEKKARSKLAEGEAPSNFPR
ncbi:MAG: hypothetical protein ICV84_04050 [Flavisolibacter sp.]|nr:hypothetical protein [Flavisolibacter sp.]